MTTQLLDCLDHRYDDFVAQKVMKVVGTSGWPIPIAEVRAVIVHVTAGWPARARAQQWVAQYTQPSHKKYKNGTQFFISGDGTVCRLIGSPTNFALKTNHATYVNEWSLGVETGNPADDRRITPPGHGWIELSARPDDEILGAKLWIIANNGEVVPYWSATGAYSGAHAKPLIPNQMLFSEWQYRAWAVLTRYLLEKFSLPRNFPLLPHARRGDFNRDSVLFRRVVLADARADMMKRAFAKAPISISETSFDDSNASTLQTEYQLALWLRPSVTRGTAPNIKITTYREQNRAWTVFIEQFKGIHTHALSGALVEKVEKRTASGSKTENTSDKLLCPGPLFDHHRLAREVWDWWWYPFDIRDLTTAVLRREYRQWNGKNRQHWDENTPLLEYYYDDSEAGHRLRSVATGIHGSASSPSTFWLNAKSPVYALANGELVAARFPPPGAGVSLAFVLVRHEVYHRRTRPPATTTVPGTPSPRPGAIEYNVAPSYVYSLYMHLGRPTDMTFEQVHDDNPDWLNRVLIRKKECDLGVHFHDVVDVPPHHGIAAAAWISLPPGVPQRPTALEGWRADQTALGAFLDALKAGSVAIPPLGPWNQRVRVLLGDFLGESGVVRQTSGTASHGIRIEIFSPTFRPPGSTVTNASGWDPVPGPATPFDVLRYDSEWARVPEGAQAAELEANGVDLSQLSWWASAAISTHLDPLFPSESKLPFSGRLFHYLPLDFMKWMNTVTWEHEWPKYDVRDPPPSGSPPGTLGNLVPVSRQPRPPSRRI